MNEATITINGVQLTSGQSLTVRVALQSFAGDLAVQGLGTDDIGKLLVKGYLDRIVEINEIIRKGCK